MIESYSFGEIVIKGKRYSSDVIIFRDRVDDSWWRKEGHSLCPEDLKKVIKAEPEIIVIGTGNSGLMEVPSQTRDYIASCGIELFIQPTEEACQTYNRLAKSRRVIACLHLTC